MLVALVKSLMFPSRGGDSLRPGGSGILWLLSCTDTCWLSPGCQQLRATAVSPIQQCGVGATGKVQKGSHGAWCLVQFLGLQGWMTFARTAAVFWPCTAHAVQVKALLQHPLLAGGTSDLGECGASCDDEQMAFSSCYSFTSLQRRSFLFSWPVCFREAS